MNQMNLAAMNAGNPAAGNMPMMNKMPNGIIPQQTADQPADFDARLNTWIYGYFLEQGQYDLARSLKDSNMAFDPPIVNSEDETNGVSEDTKGNLKDKNRPADLPVIRNTIDFDGASMLSGWFAVFWDVFAAHRKRHNATQAATQLMEQNRMRAQGRGDTMFRGVNGGMMPNSMDMNLQQLMMRDGNLRQKALQNQQQGFRGINPQMAAMQRNMMLQQPQQQGMRRDPSGMDMNGQRPRTPSSGDHAPSPKRPRVDGAGFTPQQMMQNGRPPPGMPPTMDNPQNNALLVSSGINPANLSESQWNSFQQQHPNIKQQSIQTYAQNISKNQREDPMNMTNGGADFYNNQQLMRAGIGPTPGAAGGQGNHALQDYQMQLMLLEQQNKKRLLMARQEQDGPGQPAMPAGFAPGMSPSGSRGGPSPGPGGERRGTPKLGAPVIDGSPLPDGSMRGSPAAIQTLNGMQPDLYPAMAAGVRPPPSSNPAFNGQFNPQQLQMRPDGTGRIPGANWQGGPPGQVPMGQQPPMGQQGPQMGTPQQRNNEMPPPQAPPAGGANGRNGSDEAPPTPQPANKNNPKPKKDSKKAKGEGKGKKNSNSVAATPASEAEAPPPTPTPSTPITPSHPSSFTQKDASNLNTNANANPQQVPAPTQDLNVSAQFNPTGPGEDQPDGYNNASFTDPMQGSDLLDNFNFEEFLDNNAFQIDLAQVDMTDMMEPMADAA